MYKGIRVVYDLVFSPEIPTKRYRGWWTVIWRLHNVYEENLEKAMWWGTVDSINRSIGWNVSPNDMFYIGSTLRWLRVNKVSVLMAWKHGMVSEYLWLVSKQVIAKGRGNKKSQQEEEQQAIFFYHFKSKSISYHSSLHSFLYISIHS